MVYERKLRRYYSLVSGGIGVIFRTYTYTQIKCVSFKRILGNKLLH